MGKINNRVLTTMSAVGLILSVGVYLLKEEMLTHVNDIFNQKTTIGFTYMQQSYTDSTTTISVVEMNNKCDVTKELNIKFDAQNTFHLQSISGRYTVVSNGEKLYVIDTKNIDVSKIEADTSFLTKIMNEKNLSFDSANLKMNWYVDFSSLDAPRDLLSIVAKGKNDAEDPEMWATFSFDPSTMEILSYREYDMEKFREALVNNFPDIDKTILSPNGLRTNVISSLSYDYVIFNSYIAGGAGAVIKIDKKDGKLIKVLEGTVGNTFEFMRPITESIFLLPYQLRIGPMVTSKDLLVNSDLEVMHMHDVSSLYFADNQVILATYSTLAGAEEGEGSNLAYVIIDEEGIRIAEVPYERLPPQIRELNSTTGNEEIYGLINLSQIGAPNVVNTQTYKFADIEFHYDPNEIKTVFGDKILERTQGMIMTTDNPDDTCIWRPTITAEQLPENNTFYDTGNN